MPVTKICGFFFSVLIIPKSGGADILTHEGVFGAGNSIRVVLPSEDGQYDLLGLTETGDNYYRSLALPEPGTSAFIDITEADRR